MTKEPSINRPDYNSPKSLSLFLEQNGMSMLKKFGQNFMLNSYARTKIASDLGNLNGSTVWEIGPGLGCMTEELLKARAKVIAFEIDRGFISSLKHFFADESKNKTLIIIEGDVLKTWEKEIDEGRKPKCVFGNLPYNIAATFIADTISRGVIFEKCVFTVQKEVAERMIASPGKESYSAFSVLCQRVYDVSPGLVLSPKNFWPKPSVSSQEVIMTKKESFIAENNPFFVRIVHTLFSSRRKTIQNNIKQLLPHGIRSETFFEKCGISGERRAETLTVAEFEKICEILRESSLYDRIENEG